MTREQLNEIAESCLDAFLAIGGDTIHLQIKVPGKPKATLLFGINERSDQLTSFADAIGLKKVPIVADEEIIP